MNLMGMSLVAGVECLVQQPREKITETTIPDRDKVVPMKWWRPGPSRQRDSDEAVETRAIETKRGAAVKEMNVSTE